MGDFKHWNAAVTPMVKKGKRRTSTLTMPPGRRHAFRYLSEWARWSNDEAADAYEPKEFGVDYSILDLTQARLGPDRP